MPEAIFVTLKREDLAYVATASLGEQLLVDESTPSPSVPPSGILNQANGDGMKMSTFSEAFDQQVITPQMDEISDNQPQEDTLLPVDSDNMTTPSLMRQKTQPETDNTTEKDNRVSQETQKNNVQGHIGALNGVQKDNSSTTNVGTMLRRQYTSQADVPEKDEENNRARFESSSSAIKSADAAATQMNPKCDSSPDIEAAKTLEEIVEKVYTHAHNQGDIQSLYVEQTNDGLYLVKLPLRGNSEQGDAESRNGRTLELRSTSVTALHRQFIALTRPSIALETLKNMKASPIERWMQRYGVMCFGRGDEGQLGLGISVTSHAPALMDAGWFGGCSRADLSRSLLHESKRKKRCFGDIVAIALGRRHSLLQTSGGGIYSCGLNGSGQLGIGIGRCVRLMPAELPALHQREIFGIAAGDAHSLCVTRQGIVYGWGSCRNGQLGLGVKSSTVVRTPTPLPFFRPEEEDLSGNSNASSTHSLSEWLDRQGRYIETTLLDRHGRTDLHSNDDDEVGRVVTVRAGGSTSAAITANGFVFMWGQNHYGQCGIASTEAVPLPKQLKSLDDWQVVDISIGEDHVLARTSAGKVLSWGKGLYGRLGLGDEANRLSPQRVCEPKEFKKAEITCVSAGTTHSLALDANGDIWCWGDASDNKLGRLNVADGNVTTPHKMQFSSAEILGLQDAEWIPKVTGVRAGERHSIALTSVEEIVSQANGGESPGVVSETTPKKLIGGHVYVWGSNKHKALGLGELTLKWLDESCSEENSVASIQSMCDMELILQNQPWDRVDRPTPVPGIGIPTPGNSVELEGTSDGKTNMLENSMLRVAADVVTSHKHTLCITKLVHPAQAAQLDASMHTQIDSTPDIPLYCSHLTGSKETTDNLYDCVAPPPLSPFHEMCFPSSRAAVSKLTKEEYSKLIENLECIGNLHFAWSFCKDELEKPSVKSTSVRVATGNAYQDLCVVPRIPRRRKPTKENNEKSEHEQISKANENFPVDDVRRPVAPSEIGQEWNAPRNRGFWSRMLSTITCRGCGVADMPDDNR